MHRKYWLAALVKAALIAIVLAPATPQAVSAQDCGTNCATCAVGKKEGYTYHPDGDYDMACLTATTGCFTCVDDPGGMVKDAAPAPAELLRTLRSVPLESLGRLAPTLKDRLLVHPARNLVAVRGEACQASAVTALAFLPRERIEILARSGLPELKGFLDQAVKQAP